MSKNINKGIKVKQTKIKLLPAAADDAWCSRRRILSGWAASSWRKAPGCSGASFDGDCLRGPVTDAEPVWSPAGKEEEGETGAQVESALTNADNGLLSWSINLPLSWGAVSGRCLTANDNKTCINSFMLGHLSMIEHMSAAKSSFVADTPLLTSDRLYADRPTRFRKTSLINRSNLSCTPRSIE